MTRVVAACALLVAACGSPKDSGPADSFDRTALLTSLAERVIFPATGAAADTATILATRTQEYCTALGGPGEAAALTTAQAAWRDAMAAWQLLEVMRIGPIADNGGDLRDQIYSWPVVSTCAVDQDVSELRAAPGTFDIATRLPNRKGLDALEYLLFQVSLDHSCPPQSAPAGWNALAAADRRAARCALAQTASAEVAGRTAEVRQSWDPSDGNFAGSLAAHEGWSNAHDAVNSVSDALFYLDSTTKDLKLAEPAGLTVNRCGSEGNVCPDELESPFARHSRENILANLRGVRMMFRGDDLAGNAGVGFDDFLVELGAPALAADMSSKLDAAIGAAEVLGTTLHDALGTPLVTDLHNKVKAVTDDMKSQYLTVLGLDLPDAAAGDND